MKLAFAAPFGLQPKGTVSARALPLGQELVQRGHDVSVIIPPYDDSGNSGKTLHMSGVTVKNVSLPEKLRGPLFHVRMTQIVLEQVLSERADVVHVFKPKGYAGLVGMASRIWNFSRSRSSSLVLDMDDYEGYGGWNDRIWYPRLWRYLFEFQERAIPFLSSAVTVASHELARLLRNRGISETRIFHLPNGISPVDSREPTRERSWTAKKNLGLEDRHVVLLYTRFFEFSPLKLIQIIKHVSRQIRDIQFVVVGKGTFGEEVEIKKLAVKEGVQSQISWFGWVPPSELPSYFSIADVAMYPMDDTLINRCKCPAKLAQLLAWGIPTVAEAVGEIPYYIENERSGVLVREGEYADFSRGVVSLLRNPVEAGKMGEEAQKRMSDKFSWKLLARRLERAYGYAIETRT